MKVMLIILTKGKNVKKSILKTPLDGLEYLQIMV